MSWRRPMFVHLVLALVLAISCLAAGNSGPRFSFRHYGSETGLGDATILSLLQDRAGYLWVGTEAGLYHFDGSRFRLIGANEGLACLAEIRGLAQAEDGSLWAVACNRLYRSSGGWFEMATQHDIIMNSKQGIVSDGKDGVLVGTLDGLLQASNRRDEKGYLTVRQFPLPEPVRGKPVHGVYREGNKVWFGCEKALYSWRPAG